jgi:hypothetical protein
MCFLPCWPFSDLYLEEEPRKKKNDGVVFYDQNTKTFVKLTGVVPVSLFSFLAAFDVWELERKKFSLVLPC